MNRNSGNHIGDRLYTYERQPKNNVNALLLAGFSIQTLVLLHLALTSAKPTPCIQSQFNVGTTGNVYITQPQPNTEGGR